MPTTQMGVKSQAVELSIRAYEAFCEDISGMFGVEMACSHQETCAETVAGLKKRFKKLTAVNIVEAKGVLNGNFQLIFDQGGLFTLSGVIVMLPEKRILEEIKRGNIKDVESMNDAVKEVGNLLVGSWDRIFREEFEGHGHFVQTDTFIGIPWDKPGETIGLADNEECEFVLYEMTVESYPVFTCGVIFPKKIFGGASEAAPEPEAEPEAPPEPEAEPEAASESESADIKTESAEKKTEDKKPEINDSSEIQTVAQDDKGQKESNDVLSEESNVAGKESELAETTQEKFEENIEAAETKSDIEQKPDNLENTTSATESKEKAAKTTEEKIVSQNNEKEKQITAVTPAHSDQIPLSVCAKDIMDQNVIWCCPGDSVQQAMTKMQQHETDYLLVGKDGALEGIVSKLDISGAISPYLRAMFAKWRRPHDDATLQIRLKWIMSKPVRTVNLDTPVARIVETMRNLRGRCLPVVDQKGEVKGIVTVFDVFKILNKDIDTSVNDKTTQVPSIK